MKAPERLLFAHRKARVAVFVFVATGAGLVGSLSPYKGMRKVAGTGGALFGDWILGIGYLSVRR